MKLALLSNVTVELLAGMLKRHHSVWTPSGFGAWMETALQPPPELVEFRPEAIYLLLDSRFIEIHGDVEAARQALSSHFPSVPVCVLDVSRFAVDFADSFYDEKMWKLGKMPWSLKGLRELVKVFSLKKVLALDLDNTLWDGVVGEVGQTGVRIKEPFLNEIRELKDRGVLLTVLSKNNYDDVRWFFGENDPFVAKGINWDSKADNLTKMAQELNLGSDSFVFVDDNPAERAEMRARHPEVLVADFPPQLEAFFPRRELTAEDVEKTEQYKAESKRKELATRLSVAEYLESLGIWVRIHPMEADEIPRVAQLSQKTNQFNVCTNRYTEEEIRSFMADPRRLILALRTGDRFGEQGLVAFVHLCDDEIVDWVMSCRTMNRTVEFAMESEVERLAMRRRIRSLRAAYRPTLKNAPVRELYEKFGFRLLNVGDDGVKRYELDLPRVQDLVHACKMITQQEKGE